MKQLGSGLTEGFTLPNLLSGSLGAAFSQWTGRYPTVAEILSRLWDEFHQFTQTGRLGCGQCYDSYASQIEPILRRSMVIPVIWAGYLLGGEKVRLQKTIKDLKKEPQDAVSRGI